MYTCVYMYIIFPFPISSFSLYPIIVCLFCWTVVVLVYTPTISGKVFFFSPQLHQHLLVLFCFVFCIEIMIRTILSGVGWNLSTVVICISLMANDDEQI